MNIPLPSLLSCYCTVFQGKKKLLSLQYKFIIYSFIHAFNYLLSPYFVPDTVLDFGDTMANQTKTLPSQMGIKQTREF